MPPASICKIIKLTVRNFKLILAQILNSNAYIFDFFRLISTKCIFMIRFKKPLRNAPKKLRETPLNFGDPTILYVKSIVLFPTCFYFYNDRINIYIFYPAYTISSNNLLFITVTLLSV